MWKHRVDGKAFFFLVGKVYVSMVGYVVWVKYVFMVGCVAWGGYVSMVG